MILSSIILQVKSLATDSVSTAKLQAMTDSVKAKMNTLTNPDSIANFTPGKIAQGIKTFDWSEVFASLSTQMVSLVLRILAAIVIFYVGKFIINKIYSITRTLMVKKKFDRSLSSFLLSFIRMSMLFLLIITVISILGIETSSFIAIFASAGVAIGMALSGTLQNFAGGVLILMIKPFKIGDYIEFGNYKGFVKEIQIFNTILVTYNNDKIIIPNGGLSTGTINNLSTEQYRRLEWRISISYGDNVDQARKAILDIINDEERIVRTIAESTENATATSESTSTDTPDTEPTSKKNSWWKRHFGKPDDEELAFSNDKGDTAASTAQTVDYKPYVAVESLGDSAVVLIVRAWALASDYWSVLYAVNEKIYYQLPLKGIHFPFPQLDVHVVKEQ